MAFKRLLNDTLLEGAFEILRNMEQILLIDKTIKETAVLLEKTYQDCFLRKTGQVLVKVDCTKTIDKTDDEAIGG